MEEVKISYVSHYHHDDFDELNLRINNALVRPIIAQLADDAHNVYLQVDAEDQRVLGATILYADDWFAELATAFKRRDLTHPDVRFFFEQKIKMFAAQWAAEPRATLSPSSPESWRMALEDDSSLAINKVVETQPA